MKTSIIFAAILVSIFALSPCAQDDDTLNLRTHAIQTNPLSMLSGAVGVNYEYLFLPRNGVAVEAVIGASPVYKGFGAGLHYRRHYHSKPGHKGLDSPFWGPFINVASFESEMQYTESGSRGSSTYTIPFSATYAAIGLNWGRRWVWNNGFSVVTRIGYGLPIVSLDIDDSEHEMEAEARDMVVTVMKVVYGIDGELSIGFAF